MRRLVSAVCLLAAGCYQQRMGAWMGHSYYELLSAWGTPSTRQLLHDGSAVLAWEDVETGPEGHNVCRRSFTLDRTGRIVQWAIDDCDWRTTHIPEPPRTP